VAQFLLDFERLTDVEPFCGSAAVLFAKRQSHCEHLNDLVINFVRLQRE